ncbi:MAG: hypothetical protein IT168_31335 [Bryobacterales bacterium]|nr:hypothetical protein [Bryobacterales bacterium]
MLKRLLLGVTFVGIGSALAATGPAIGVATATGSFVMDRAAVQGNGTVFDGAVIETTKVTPDVVLNSGAKFRLGTESRGKVYRDRLVLEKGAGQVTAGSNFAVEASRLRLVPSSGNAVAKIEIARANFVQIAALKGSLRVETSTGLALANMAEGMALAFDTQAAGAAMPMKLCGKVEKKNGGLVLTDSTTKVAVKLQGSDLDQYAGKSIAVEGNPTGSGAQQTLQVLSAKADACSSKAGAAGAGGAAAAGAAGAAGAGAATGLSTAAIAGIVIGAGAGLGLGVAAATGAFDDSSR